jgi:hypothetical protein
VVTPPPALPAGDGRVFAVGDSVLLGAKDSLSETVGGWDLYVDARVSRRFPEGIDVLRQNRAALGQVVVVVLGHNYGGGGKVYGYLDEIMAETSRTQRVVMVTVAEWSPAQVEVNRAIRSLPNVHRNVVVADWQAVTAANPQFLAGDRVHLTGAGRVALANLIAVMVGPAPARDGRTLPPPRILPIPDDGSTGGTGSSSTTTSRAPVTTTTGPSGTTTTTAPTTTTTVPSTVTTTTETTTTATATSSTSTTSTAAPTTPTSATGAGPPG